MAVGKIKAEPKISLPPGTKVPDHVAIVMDGNRRWARARGLDTLEGHKAGFDRAIQLARSAREMGIHTISLWGFSTENWDREKRELDYLMLLYRRMLDKYLKEALKEEVRLIHLGRKDRLPKDLISQIADAEVKTRHFTKHLVNICLDAGGRDDIVRAVNKYIAKKDTRPMSEKIMMEYLDTVNQPYPYVDLFIRTSGEQRTSGFMLWQAAYAEEYWELDHLPDFGSEKFKNAILDYSRRRRRFGGNDAEEHLKFNAGAVADLEVRWRHQLTIGPGETFRDLVIKYVKEHYGLSKGLAKEAGLAMAKALVYGEQKEWAKAKDSLEGLYKILQKTLKLAFEPDVIAKFEVDLWKGGQREDDMRSLLAEKFRFSNFQATKSAHLAWLANTEMGKNNWERAKWYLERFYQALKERVA